MNAPVRQVVENPMDAFRAMNKMRGAGFTIMTDGADLVVVPATQLNDERRQFIRERKPALVRLLQDAETLHRALVDAGPAGLDWREGTPADWDDARLLAADEVLYADGRMVTRQCRRYLRTCAPPSMFSQEVAP